MSKITLSLACWEYARTEPILDGTVKIEGVDLIPIRSSPPDTFWRVARYDEFDITEMSLGSLIIAASSGKARWKAIPVFPCRRFFHTWILYNKHSGISRPEDLRGKRFGVPEYQLTSMIWVRGILQDEFGIKPQDMTWFQERSEHRIPLSIPKEVSLNQIPSTNNLHSMLLNKELDALFYLSQSSSLVDRSSLPLHEHPDIGRLFPDQKSEELRYFKKTGIFPINHVLVVKDKIFESYPWAALNTFMAFNKAKEISYRNLEDYEMNSSPNIIWQRSAVLEQKSIFQSDPYPYGIKANRKVLEALTEYCYQQGLTDRKVTVDELFAENTRDL